MRLPDVGGVPVKIRGIVIIPLPEPLPHMLASSRGGDSMRACGWGRLAGKDKRMSSYPPPRTCSTALSFRSPLAALRRGGDHSRHSSGAPENTQHKLAGSRASFHSLLPLSPRCASARWRPPLPNRSASSSALSFRSPLAALRRGGDHSRPRVGRGENTVENTGLNARACRMGAACR